MYNWKLETILYFTEKGGVSTVNTGRSDVTARALMKEISAIVPFLRMNGSSVAKNTESLELDPLDLPTWTVLNRLAVGFSEVELEVQNLQYRYLQNPSPA